MATPLPFSYAAIASKPPPPQQQQRPPSRALQECNRIVDAMRGMPQKGKGDGGQHCNQERQENYCKDQNQYPSRPQSQNGSWQNPSSRPQSQNGYRENNPPRPESQNWRQQSQKENHLPSSESQSGSRENQPWRPQSQDGYWKNQSSRPQSQNGYRENYPPRPQSQNGWRQNQSSRPQSQNGNRVNHPQRSESRSESQNWREQPPNGQANHPAPPQSQNGYQQSQAPPSQSAKRENQPQRPPSQTGHYPAMQNQPPRPALQNSYGPGPVVPAQNVTESMPSFASWIVTLDRLFFDNVLEKKFLLKVHRDEIVNRLQTFMLNRGQRREVESIIRRILVRRDEVDLIALAKWDLPALRRHGDVMNLIVYKHLKVIQEGDKRNRGALVPCGRQPCLDILCEGRHLREASVTKRAAGRAFRCTMAILLTKAFNAKLIEKDEIRALKIQYHRSFTKRDRRISAIATLSALILLADSAEYQPLVQIAIKQLGVDRWREEGNEEKQKERLEEFEEGDSAVMGPENLKEEKEVSEKVDWSTFNVEKLYNKSFETMENPIITARFCVTTCNVGIGEKKASILLQLWTSTTNSGPLALTPHPDRLTLPMLCYLFAHLGSSAILTHLADAKTPGFVPPGPNSKARQTPHDRINEIEQKTYEKALALGLREECGKGNVRSLYRFCSGLLVELAGVFGELVVSGVESEIGDGWRDSESEQEEGEEVERVLTDWRELCRPLSNHHLFHGRTSKWHRKTGILLALLLSMSNGLSHQDRNSDPELFLVLLRELVRTYSCAHVFTRIVIGGGGGPGERVEQLDEEGRERVKRALEGLERKIGKEIGRDGVYVEAIEEGSLVAKMRDVRI